MNKKTVLAIVAVIVAILIVSAAVLLLSGPPPKAKYQLELWYSTGHYGDTEDELATVLQSSIEACGKVDVTLRSDIWDVYVDRWSAGDYPLFLLGWYPDYFDTDDYISPFLSTAGAESLGSFYSNATMDQWIQDEQSATTTALRADRFTKIQDQLAEDVPYVPLISGNAHVAYVSSVSNVILHPVSFKWFIIDKAGATELNASTTDHISSLDPAKAYDYFSIEVINQVFDTLLVYEPATAALMPGLATSMPTVSSDGLNYTFTVRNGIQFHDGTELNASVVKRSIERLIRLDLASSAAFLYYDTGALGNTPNITVSPNDRDITFHLQRPVAFFPDLMAFSPSAPVPWDYNQTGEQSSTAGNVVGSGPYRLTNHVADTLIELQSDPNYYKSNLYAGFNIPTIPVEDKVTINIRQTATALKQDIETKAVDVVYRTLDPLDITDLDSRETALGIKVDVGASPQIRYLVFNVETVTDVRVRQAIAYSVDRAAIDQTVFSGIVEPLYSMVPANMPYQSPVFQDRYGGSPDCGEANVLFAELGYSIRGATIWIARDI